MIPCGQENDQRWYARAYRDRVGPDCHGQHSANPVRRPQLAFSKEAKQGAVLFAQIGCANCHLPALKTGLSSVPQLNNVTFFPFSDFLLHDMGSLNDQIAQIDASGNEMRTASLWGIRVLTTFRHDGRASTLQAAILAHDGQGRTASKNFSKPSTTSKNQLIAFLNSL